MIIHLRGVLLSIQDSYLTVDVHGVGYEVQVPHSLLPWLPTIGVEVELKTRHIFREDGQYLYGFADGFSRLVFDRLIEVKGCGPKIGLALLSELGSEGVMLSIQAQDVKSLSRANGVGPRLAERIIVELKDKVSGDLLAQKIDRAVVSSRPVDPADDLIDALISLGYRRQEVESAAAVAREETENLTEQLKLALRSLRK